MSEPGLTRCSTDTTYRFANDLELALGVTNMLDDHYELAWGFPQPGRAIYAKLRTTL